MSRLRSLGLVASVIFSIIGCTRTTVPSDGSSDAAPPVSDGAKSGGTGGAATPQDADWKAIEKLEAEAKLVAHVEGCAASGDCRTAPVGSRACGGPRYYLPYCAKSTDSVALFKKLDEVANAERAWNKKYQMASTCEMRMPPLVESVGGSCAAR
jgi:hypothetical protein